MGLNEMIFDSEGHFTMRGYALGSLMSTFMVMMQVHGELCLARGAVNREYSVLHYIDPEFADELDRVMGYQSVRDLAADEMLGTM